MRGGSESEFREARMRRILLVMAAVCFSTAAWGQKPPLLPEKDVAALANELSGETAKRNLEGIARFHRQRGSKGFHEAAELVAERLRAYGLNDVTILQFPADGKVFYGTQRSRPAWDAEVGDLTETNIEVCDQKVGSTSKNTINSTICIDLSERKIASYEAEPVVLAEDSESADVTAELIDVGAGTKESDYAGKDVKGKIVLVTAQPGAVQDLAVGKYGAAGIVSYAQNQKTAWWGEDENLIRWGHLETFSANKTFAFMVSLKTAQGMKERLAKGEKISLHAVVKAGQHAGNYEVVTAAIPGADPKLKNEEIAFSCHLDHQRPGANDNASGCVTILEVARTLQKLIGNGTLARPARTIRFIWPPEIEGTMALLNAKPMKFETRSIDYTGETTTQPHPSEIRASVRVFSEPELAKRIKAVVHMDMVGGGPETKAVFHVTRGPMSLPSFVHDVAWTYAEWVNEESYKFVATGKAEYPLVAPEGGKEPLRAEYSPFTMGSDHDVYQDSSFGIPAIYLNDWPDRYIHTNFDSAANIDPTKLKRAAFIGAASGYFLAGMSSNEAQVAQAMVNRGADSRHAQVRHGHALDVRDGLCSLFFQRRYDNTVLWELERYLGIASKGEPFPVDRALCPGDQATQKMPGAGDRFLRNAEPKGPLVVFGYDYFAEHAKAVGVRTPKLLSYEGLWGSGEEYAYEVLNFANGKRNVQEIRDAVSAEYGPVPLEMVVEYLKVLGKIGVVEEVK
jgi:aminopeptidase YwaD